MITLVWILLIGYILWVLTKGARVRIKANWKHNKNLYEYPRCPYCDHPIDLKRQAVQYEENHWHPACFMTEKPHRKNLDTEPRVGRPGPIRQELT